MKRDAFTRIVLCVIAICLMYLCLRDAGVVPSTNMFKSGEPTLVRVVNTDPVPVGTYAKVDLGYGSGLVWVPVRAEQADIGRASGSRPQTGLLITKPQTEDR